MGWKLILNMSFASWNLPSFSGLMFNLQTYCIIFGKETFEDAKYSLSRYRNGISYNIYYLKINQMQFNKISFWQIRNRIPPVKIQLYPNAVNKKSLFSLNMDPFTFQESDPDRVKINCTDLKHCVVQKKSWLIVASVSKVIYMISTLP